MRFASLLFVTVLASFPAHAAPDFAPAVKADYDQRLEALFDWFHRHPELSYMETATAARMAKELRAIQGIDVTEKVGGTGVVGVMRNGPGPVARAFVAVGRGLVALWMGIAHALGSLARSIGNGSEARTGTITSRSNRTWKLASFHSPSSRRAREKNRQKT